MDTLGSGGLKLGAWHGSKTMFAPCTVNSFALVVWGGFFFLNAIDEFSTEERCWFDMEMQQLAENIKAVKGPC